MFAGVAAGAGRGFFRFAGRGAAASSGTSTAGNGCDPLCSEYWTGGTAARSPSNS